MKLIKSIKEYAKTFKKQKFYDPKNLEGSETEESPCGKYELIVERFKTGENTWSYTRGTVKNKATGDTIAVVNRNYHSFWRCWVDDHPDGHDYLLCGEDYQGQTIIRLDEPARHDHVPTSAANGMGFCWADANVSPDKTILVVEGCYWGAPYEIRFCDFSEPFKHPVDFDTKEELHYRFDRFFGWKDKDTAIVGYEEEFRASDGTPVIDLSEEEEEKAYDEDDLDYRDVTANFKIR